MKELKCTWCQKAIAATEVQVRRHRGEHGTVIERRCPHCGRVLAAYLEEEKDFFSRIRTF